MTAHEMHIVSVVTLTRITSNYQFVARCNNSSASHCSHDAGFPPYEARRRAALSCKVCVNIRTRARTNASVLARGARAAIMVCLAKTQSSRVTADSRRSPPLLARMHSPSQICDLLSQRHETTEGERRGLTGCDVPSFFLFFFVFFAPAAELGSTRCWDI